MMPSRQCAMVGALFAVALMGASLARANNVTFTFERPSANRHQENTVEFEFRRNGNTERVQAAIPPESSGGGKRDAIKSALEAANFDVSTVGLTGLRIEGLPAGTEVRFEPGQTGEPRDTQTATAATSGAFGFAGGLFNPIDSLGQPAVFTGGFITDLGEFTATVSAANLLMTDGFSITQALYAQLLPQASAAGASIVNGGDMLTVNFDPAYATGEVGVVFGTTSPSAGAFSSMSATPEPASLGAVLLAATTLLRRRL